MKKFEGILFASDLDGTLLRKDKTISRENKDAIAYFMNQGGIFTFVTGRIPIGAEPVLSQFTPNAPIVCMNGGGIYNPETKEIPWFLSLDRDVMELVEMVDHEIPQVGIEVNMIDKIYFCKKNRSTETHRINESFPDLTCHYLDVTDSISKILFAAEAEYMEPLANLLHAHPRADDYEFVRSDKEYYEILPKGSGKGTGLKQLGEYLHISMNRTIGAGDNDNDIPLLQTAGIGIAVANATESAKAAADMVYPFTNEEHAIAKIIEDLDRGTLVVS